MLEIIKRKIFISGGFSETFEDIQTLEILFNNAGMNAVVKYNEYGPTTQELIDKCEYFACVMGIEESGIKTPSGDTLPQLELNFAIRLRKPIIAFLKYPLEKGKTPDQESYRNLFKKKFGESLIVFDDKSQLSNKVIELLKAGIEPFSKIIRPLKVFISYSSKDKSIVEDLLKRIKQAGLKTFYDDHDIGIGQNLKKTIQRAIAEVGYVIVCLSKHALESEWVQNPDQPLHPFRSNVYTYSGRKLTPIPVQS